MKNIKIVTCDKYQGDGRAFGTSQFPIKQLITCISTDGSLPNTYEDIEGCVECEFAPGSIVMDTANKKTYIYDGTTFKEWG